MKKFILSLTALCLSTYSFAQEEKKAQHSLGDIARAIKNPVSLLYRIPVHNDFEVGDVDNQLRYTLKAEPVVPFILNANWKINTRSTLSFVANEYNGVEGNGPTGLSDLDITGFLSPMHPAHGFVWGVGAALDFPTATNTLLGNGKWTAGPSLLGLKQTKSWTFGLLLRQAWSYAGSPDRPDVSYAFVNPWIDYTFENGFGLKVESESTFDWKSDEHIIPLRFGTSQVFKMGKKWIGNIDLDGIYYVKAPDTGPKWGVSLTFTMLLKHIAYVKK